jgi:GlcNAc-P-P-Und epimerase
MGNHYLNFFKYINIGLYFNVTTKKCFKSFSYIGNLIFQIEKLISAESNLVNKKTFYLSDYQPLELHDWAKKISINLSNKTIYSIPIQISYLLGIFFNILQYLKIIKKVPISIYNIKNISTSYLNNNDLFKITGPLPYNLNEAIIETTNWYKKINEN